MYNHKFIFLLSLKTSIICQNPYYYRNNKEKEDFITMNTLIAKIVDSAEDNSKYAVVNKNIAKNYNLLLGQLVELYPFNIGLMVVSSEVFPMDYIGIPQKVAVENGIKEGDIITVKQIVNETIIQYLHKKMKGEHLKEEEFNYLFSAIDKNLMHSTQIASLMTLFQVVGLTLDETTSIAKSIVSNSRLLELKRKPIVDKHSIGGIPGNRITPIMISILAASGLTIPKISTRAITSPAGTIDTAELYMPCDLTLAEMQDVVNATGACIVSGENVDLADTSDKIIRVLDKIKIDPKEFMVASILAKKIAAGSEYVLIDLPTGKGAKVLHREDAQKVGGLFTSIGYSLKMHLDCIISPGDRPIGSMIGPALEARDCLRILKNQQGSTDLKNKALSLCGIILESQNWCPRGYGYEYAEEILNSGKAYEKFKEVIEAQGGDPNINEGDLPLAKEIATITAKLDGVVYGIDGLAIATIARQAGAPYDKTAGVKIIVKRGEKVNKDQPLFEIHSASSGRLTKAIEIAETRLEPIDMERMVLDVIYGPKDL